MILIPSDVFTNLPSIAVQEGLISAGLNASMVQDVLAGIYTMVYSGAVYFYITRKKPHIRIVVSSMTLMYILSMMTFIIEWWWLDQWMVDDGATRETMFLANIEGPPPSVFVFNNFVIYLSFLVSEVFLVWRCYIVWDMSVRVILVPAIVCFGQFCMLFASVGLSSLARGGHPEKLSSAHQYNNVISAFVLASLITIVITTVLLAQKIEPLRLLNPTKFQRTMANVMIVLLESGAISIPMLLFLAVLGLMPESYRLGSTELIVSYYAQFASSIVMGMTPALMILSVSLKNGGGIGSKKTAAVKSKIVSELRFGAAPGVGRSHRSTNLSLQIVSASHGNVQPEVLVSGFKGGELEGIPETEKM